ncbi:hypothetical protein GFS24_26735 [Chitinophaga sp. SYP-B3965]|uniref:ligand-binding sensor domain-containing protein n=1 Tax=Chitinophaga sp. SYP-B3965 TaxID=2663120 RepID=UPI001299738B|nr:triple tyrosine motif-containing protein [Chitinophaga sp. SYP-B3965]MRG48737.1 hypothetical protein [Chitinophaga sp. SYP-B3965]
MLRCFLNTLLFLCLGYASLWGQQKQFHSFHNYTQKDGLSSYNITKIRQDKFGFFWIATQDGLNCFDGRKFRVFNKVAQPLLAIKGNNVTDLVEDTLHNRLYLAAFSGGLSCINTLTQTTLQDRALQQANVFLSKKWIRCLALSGNTLWIGLYEGICSLDLQTGEFSPPDKLAWKGIPTDTLRVKRITTCGNRVVICCDGYGLIVLDPKSGKPVNTLPASMLNFYDDPVALEFWNGEPGKGDTLYLATNWGLRLMHFKGLQPTIENPIGNSITDKETVFACTPDAAGNLWITNKQGLYRLTKGKGSYTLIQDVNNTENTWGSIIYVLFNDKRNNIWAGSEEGLSYVSCHINPFEKYYRSSISPTRIQHAFALYMEGKDSLLCGASNGLYQVNLAERSIQRIDSNSAYYLIGALPDNQILISNNQGIFIRNQEGLVPASTVYPALKPLQHIQMNTLCSYSDSLVVLSSLFNNGLYVWNCKSGQIRSFSRRQKNLLLDDETVTSLFMDKQKNLFVISTSTIFRFNPVTGENKVYHIPDKGVLMDMCETSHHYWLAIYGAGLVRVNKDFTGLRIFSEKEGLCNNGVNKVFAYKDNMILVTSNNGLSTLDIPSLRFRNYAQSDGLHSNAFEQSSGFQTGNFIYAGGINGFTRINPAGFTNDTIPPQIRISGIQIHTPGSTKDTTHLQMQSLKIPSDVLQTSIFFSALHFSNPDKISFAYKIDELQKDWIDIGHQNNINLIGLAPGTYSLFVKAMNEDGAMSSLSVPLKLIYLPKWYQTLLFKISILLIAGGILLGFFQYRIFQLRQQQQIRKDIASDLHDDIGSTLNTVKIYAHLAKSGDQVNLLQQMEESVSQAITGLRDLLWVLDEKDDSVAGLLERIKKMTSPVTIAHQIALHCSTNEAIGGRILSKKEKRNLLLIAKEAVNNAIKYADCTMLEIRFMEVNNKLTLQIRDNGKGFDLNDRSDTGYGLRNMQDRATQIGYQLKLNTAPGNGVEVWVMKNR